MLVIEKHFQSIKPELLINIICNLSKDISNNYICDILSCENTEIMFYSFDNSNEDNVDLNNCPCCLIYKIQKTEDEINVFIMFLATKYRFRNLGYAKIFLNEFMDFIVCQHKNEYNVFKNINIILDSIESSVCFYEKIGFEWVDTDKYNIDLNIDIENENYSVEHFIMVKKIDL